MDYVLSSGGLLVHSRKDWPCAVCCPDDAGQGPGRCLCVSCAYSLVAAAEAGLESAHAMLGDLTDALGMLSAPDFAAGSTPN